MKIKKAVLTIAGRKQRNLPMQTLIDQDGVAKSLLAILIEEIVDAGVEDICAVVAPGDEEPFGRIAREHAGRLAFVQQPEPLGYADAISRARDFTGGEPFLHLVGDHVYVSRSAERCARHVVKVAEAEECAVSAVATTREGDLVRFGCVGGQPVPGRQGLYRIDTVVEKPTPTEAEQRLVVPGLRAGHYLCFFGLHVLTPTVMNILAGQLEAASNPRTVTLSDALAELATREQYLALEKSDKRYDLGDRYGLLTAQLALALSGRDREEVLSRLVDLLSTGAIAAGAR